MHFFYIHTLIEELGIWQGSSPDIFSSTSDIVLRQDASAGKKIWGKSDVAKNRFFNLFVFILPVLSVIFCSCSAKKNGEVAALDDSALIVSTDVDFLMVRSTIPTKDRERLSRFYPKTLQRLDKRQPLTIQDVQNMTRSGLDDETIVHEIQATNTRFLLTLQDEIELSQAGVSKKLIKAMKETIQSKG